MISFRKRFVTRIIATYSIIVLISGSMFYAIIYWELLFYRDMRDQELSWDLAHNLVQRFQPLAAPTLRLNEVEHLIAEVQTANPGVRVYLLNARGESIVPVNSDFRRHNVRVPEIQRKLAIRGFVEEPIYTRRTIRSDSERIFQQDDIFSVASLQIGNEAGYLYIPLRSNLHADAHRLWGDVVVIRSIPRMMLLWCGFTFVCATPLLVLLTRRFKRMTKVINEFRTGNYSQRIDESSEDEIGMHARAFNEMADTIVANIEELQKSDELRRELVANVSHELRRPVALMSATLQTLRSSSARFDEAAKQSYINQVAESCDELTKLISDLFELSKLNARVTPFTEERFQLEELSFDLIEKFSSVAQQKNIQLHLDAPNLVPEVLGDMEMIDRCLSNLVENALRYTDEGGRVELQLRNSGERVLVSVADTGIGIPKEEVEHIFERFYRTSGAKGSDASGAGLGLAIAKKIIEQHNSEIRVESELGKGTVFSFELHTVDGEE